MCLADAYFFLKGTARLWYENNEENLSSWEKFQEQLKIAFGSTEIFIKQAEREFKNRGQKKGSVAVNRRNEPPRRPRTYATILRQPRRPVELLPRQTDVVRTDDNRTVCVHCGRPGYVVRYCRERRAIFDAYRNPPSNQHHDIILEWNFLKTSEALVDCGLSELTLDDVKVTSEEVVLKPLRLCAMKDCRLQHTR
ncbi:CCHC-type domain-containing protein [Trichonephila clavipes]|nr:CCHC-type domain-containing protein [Trichonephila clavipes]